MSIFLNLNHVRPPQNSRGDSPGTFGPASIATAARHEEIQMLQEQNLILGTVNRAYEVR